MNRIKLAVIAGGALFATPVFAQGVEGTVEGEADATVEGDVGVDVNADAAANTGMEGTTDATIQASASLWSRIAIDRPYVLGAGKVAAYGSYGVVAFSFTDPVTMMTFEGTGDGLGVGGAYGVTDVITAGAQYGFTPGLVGDNDSDIAGTLDVFGEFQLVHDAQMSVTASADLALDFSGDETSAGINAGLGARYNLAPTMAVFTGAPYGPGPVGQHLSISFDEGNAMSFDVPVGFMFQATPELNVNFQTALARIAFNDAAGETVVFGADYIPLSLGVLFSATPNVDVVGAFALPDAKEAGFDLYAFSVGGRWYN